MGRSLSSSKGLRAQLEREPWRLRQLQGDGGAPGDIKALDKPGMLRPSQADPAWCLSGTPADSVTAEASEKESQTQAIPLSPGTKEAVQGRDRAKWCWEMASAYCALKIMVK